MKNKISHPIRLGDRGQKVHEFDAANKFLNIKLTDLKAYRPAFNK